jgi:excisionase family DNA binding protein
MSASTVASHRKPLDVAGAAEYLGMTPRFVRRLVDERRIAFLKVGRFVRLDPDVLDQFLEDCVISVDEWKR